MSAGGGGRKKAKVDVTSCRTWLNFFSPQSVEETFNLNPNIVAYSPKDDIFAIAVGDDTIRMYRGRTNEYMQAWPENEWDEDDEFKKIMSGNLYGHKIIQMEFSCNGVLAVITATYNPLELNNPPAIFFLSPFIEYHEGELSSYAKLSPPYFISKELFVISGISWDISGTKLYFSANSSTHSYVGYIPPPNIGEAVKGAQVHTYDSNEYGEVRNICCTGQTYAKSGVVVITKTTIFYFPTDEGDEFFDSKGLSSVYNLKSELIHILLGSTLCCCIAWNPMESCVAVGLKRSVWLWYPLNEVAPWKKIISNIMPLRISPPTNLQSVQNERLKQQVTHSNFHKVQVKWSPDHSKLAINYHRPFGQKWNDVCLIDPFGPVNADDINFFFRSSLTNRKRMQKSDTVVPFVNPLLANPLPEYVNVHNFIFVPSSASITELYVCRGQQIERWILGTKALPFVSNKMFDLFIV